MRALLFSLVLLATMRFGIHDAQACGNAMHGLEAGNTENTSFTGADSADVMLLGSGGAAAVLLAALMTVRVMRRRETSA